MLPQQHAITDALFGRMTEPETAQPFGATERTVVRDWVQARGWLWRTLCDDES